MKKKWFIVAALLSIFAALGLSQVVETGSSLRLDWDDNTESDLSHYNVYLDGVLLNSTTLAIPIGWREGENGEQIVTATREVFYTEVDGAKIVAPGFVHLGLSSGLYKYTVTAVDNSGNESEHSKSVWRLIWELIAPDAPKGLR